MINIPLKQCPHCGAISEASDVHTCSPQAIALKNKINKEEAMVHGATGISDVMRGAGIQARTTPESIFDQAERNRIARQPEYITRIEQQLDTLLREVRHIKSMIGDEQ